MLTPPPCLTRGHALFLDLDGTLLELAQTPEAVVVPEGLVALLRSLSTELSAALALVTGRSLLSVDHLFAPWRVVGAGLHGVEMRWPGSSIVERQASADIRPVVRRLRTQFGGDPAIYVEDKGAAVALHFRLAPARAGECEAVMIAATSQEPGLRLLHGHCVIEALPADADKGRAIARLMARAPFAGRVPAFVGDDVTDEDAFPVVAGFGGLCIKVGHGPTCAAHGLDGPGSVQEWLRSTLGSLQSGRDESSEP